MRIRSERLIWREIGDELVALDLESSTYFTANRSGAIILRSLTNGAGTSELVEALQAEYDVGPGQAKADVDEFLEVLERHGLLDRGENSSQ